MIIEKIELYHFGSYEGHNLLDVAPDRPEKRMVVIGGKNGAGKTTLFTAMQVGLYGHSAFGFKIAGKLYFKEIFDLVNSRARIDEAQCAYVRIGFAENRIDTDRYEITRLWRWSDGQVTETFSVVQNGEPLDGEAAADFQNYLLHLIPPELLNLYFFDGEKIAAYFLGEDHSHLKDALLILSGNDTYEILYGQVKRLAHGAETENHELARNYTDEKEAWETYIREEEELVLSQNQWRDQVNELDAEIKNEGENYAAGGGVSLEEWTELQRQLKDEELQRERIKNEARHAAADMLPFLIVKDLLPQIREQIRLEKEFQSYATMRELLAAPGLKRSVLKVVKKLGSLRAGEDAAEIVEAIQRFFENPSMEKIQVLFKLSEDDAAAVLNTVQEVERFDSSIFSAYSSRLAESFERGKAIRVRLQKSSIECLEEHLQRESDLKEQRRQAQNQVDQLQLRLTTLRQQMAEQKKRCDGARKALEAELKKRSVSSLAGRMLLLVEELQEQQYEKLILAVERDINKKFQELIRKEHFVDQIQIGPDFSLHVIRYQDIDTAVLLAAARKHGIRAVKDTLKERGFRALLERLSCTEQTLLPALEGYEEEAVCLPVELDYERFSNGEKQILVMALYWAIMNQSESRLPFIIDTPFARIDSEHRANITEKFFKELPGQLFVLSTNEELRQEHLEALDGQIAKIYMLEYGDDKRTHISQGSYFEV